MNLEPIIQREVSQKQKDKYCMLMQIYIESRKKVLKNLFKGQQWAFPSSDGKASACNTGELRSTPGSGRYP